MILACRSAERAEAARANITKSTGNEDVIVMLLDLGSLSSVRQFAEEFNRSAFSLSIIIAVFVIKDLRFEDKDKTRTCGPRTKTRTCGKVKVKVNIDLYSASS